MIIHFIYFMVIYILRFTKDSNISPQNLISHRAKFNNVGCENICFRGEIKIISNSNGRKERTKRVKAEESANYKHY